jgi:hypothetical protein
MYCAMAKKIRENPKIKGIKVLYSEHEISQFADDTSIIWMDQKNH